MQKKMTIYKITIGQRVYVGQTTTCPKKRLGSHLRLLRGNKHSNVYLQRSYNKHGVLDFSIIESVSTVEELDAREIFWIAHFQSTNRKFGMNISTGGAGSRGWRPSKEWRDRKSRQMKGRRPPPFSREHKENLGRVRLEWWSSEENRKRGLAQISQARKKITKEGRKKSLAAIAKFKRENPDAARISVLKAVAAAQSPAATLKRTLAAQERQGIKIKDQFGRTYGSISEAARAIDSSATNIRKQLSGRTNHNKGYIFTEIGRRKC